MRTAGVAMYTVHRAVAEDISATFGALRDMGYEEIEFYGALEDFDPAKTRQALRESGLHMTGWHTEWRELQPDRRDKTLDSLAEYGCPVAVVPCLGGKWHIGHDESGERLDTWLRYVDELNALAGVAAARGLRLGYHNHDHEFRLRYAGKCVYYWLFDRLDPDILLEFDTGNCIEGGGNPCEVLRRYAGRGVLLHLKPFSHTAGFDITLDAPGDANDWDAIFAVPGVRFEALLVESEAAHLPEMENARLCMDGLRHILARAGE